MRDIHFFLLLESRGNLKTPPYANVKPYVQHGIHFKDLFCRFRTAHIRETILTRPYITCIKCMHNIDEIINSVWSFTVFKWLATLRLDSDVNMHVQDMASVYFGHYEHLSF